MPRITISYRRDDSGVITGRIFDRLTAHYGREAVFRDIDDIPPGTDFRKHISGILDESDIVLAIVGPKWVGPRANQNRLINAADPVRVEIEAALQKDRPLIPVLVLRGAMPRPEQLPESMQDFAYRHAVTVDAGQDFDTHIARLIRAMDRILRIEFEEVAEAVLHEPSRDIGDTPFVDRDIDTTSALEVTSPTEIDALRSANAALENQVAALMAARGKYEKANTKLRNDVASTLLRSEQQEKDLTQQLAAIRETAQAEKQRDLAALSDEQKARKVARAETEQRTAQLDAALSELSTLRHALSVYEAEAKRLEGRIVELTPKDPGPPTVSSQLLGRALAVGLVFILLLAAGTVIVGPNLLLALKQWTNDVGFRK